MHLHNAKASCIGIMQKHNKKSKLKDAKQNGNISK